MTVRKWGNWGLQLGRGGRRAPLLLVRKGVERKGFFAGKNLLVVLAATIAAGRREAAATVASDDDEK